MNNSVPQGHSALTELLQLALSRAGFLSEEPDGLWGPRTEEALRRFQKDNGLPVTGVPDAATRRALLPWLVGSRFVTIEKGDTFWGLAQKYGVTVTAILTANPTLNPDNLTIGQRVVVPLWFPVVPHNISFSSEALELSLLGLRLRYPFLRVESFGKSVMGRPLRLVTVGEGETEVFYNASHHANEWLTTPLLLTFLEEYSLALSEGKAIYGIPAEDLYRNVTLFLAPMVNPDGVDLVTELLTQGPYYEQALRISGDYPAVPFPSGWKANIDGIDLNLQYPASWEEAKRIKEAAGWRSPAPRNYVGTAPLTATESRAVYDFTLAHNFKLTLSYHSQGEIIYWKYLDRLPPHSYKIALCFGTVSGYSVEETPLQSGYAGYKDWFIDRYNRPGYTIEVGKGESPLPLSQFPRIYQDNLGILALGMRLAAELPEGRPCG